MKVVLVSDSHGNMGVLLDILNAHPDADLFLHAGDIELPSAGLERYQIVQGNNDYYYDYPLELSFMTPYGKLILLHSHTLSMVHHTEKLHEYAKKHLASILCFGHTHRHLFQEEEGIYLINPGSLYYNRDGYPLGYYVLEISEEHVSANFIEI